ncbi:MAG: 3,4-dihydroxy-2-butanone-4-phosphate synthase [Alkalispirochaetaceae bacterium]
MRTDVAEKKNRAAEGWMDRMEQAIEHVRKGGMVLVRDNEGRENEGDLVCAAELVTPETIAFMAVRGRGLICQSITEETARRLQLPPQAPINRESNSTAFTVSVDAADGITTGISAADRARTASILANPDAEPGELVRPGHLFPIVAKPRGVFERQGHTEASVDLARLAGLAPSGIICEILNDDGTMARGEELEELALGWDMPLVTVEEILAYRDAVGDIPLEATAPTRLPTAEGTFEMRVFKSGDPAAEELAVLEHRGRHDAEGQAPLVRLHSECFTGESLGSERCDCGPQLEIAMREIAREGGAIVYLRQEGRGIGLFEKIRAYALQDGGMDTLEANLALGHQGDQRRYGAAARVLRERGYDRVRIMTNNPEKVAALRRAGIEVIERIPIYAGHGDENAFYMETKYKRMGHIAPERSSSDE